MSLQEQAKQTFTQGTQHVLRVVRIAFGLRSENAPRLAPPQVRLLSQRAKLIVSAVVLLAIAHALLIREIGTALDKLLAGAAPLPDLRRFLEGFSLVKLAAWGVAVLAVSVGAYAWSLRRRYQLSSVFIGLPLFVGAAGLSFQPIALHYCKSRVRVAYDKGVALFDDYEFEQCRQYFTEFHRLTQDTFIGDNALGRLAGCAYHQARYEDCLRVCAELLESYPDSDIRGPIALTARWAMQHIGPQASAELCAKLYTDLGLARWNLSPFYFCLEPEQLERNTRLDQFDSLARAQAEFARSMLGAGHTSGLGAKAAFLAGARAPLEGACRDTREGRLFRIVRGDEHMMLQRWHEALAEYAAYLDAEPRGDQRESVHLRVVRAILGRHAQLDSILAATVAALGENFDHGPRCRDLLVGRMLYEPDTAALLAAYAAWGPKLSLEMRAHMAAGISERLELDGDAAAAAEHRADARKLVAAAQQVAEVDEPWGLDLPGTAAGLAEFCNDRLTASEGARSLWDAIDFGAEQGAPAEEVAAELATDAFAVASRSHRLVWLHAIDARYQDELLAVRPPGSASYTERLCRRLESELAARARAWGDPIEAIPLLADMRPSQRSGGEGLKIVWPINFVIERSLRDLEATEWSQRTPDESLRAVVALIRIRHRVGEPKRVTAIAERALGQCASALTAGQRFADPRAAVEGAHRVVFNLGRGPSQLVVADRALLQLALAPAIELDDYVKLSHELWGFCSPAALADAQRAMYAAATAHDRELSLAFVDRCFRASAALRHAACLDLFSADMQALDLTAAPHDAARILCERIAESLGSSPLRTTGARTVVPWVYERMEAVALATGKHSVRDSLRELGLFGLCSAKTFDISKQLLDRYVATFPDDPFVENCQAWRAWLWCYEASRHRTARDVYLRCYRLAQTEYEALAANARQPLIRLNAERALHVIRRKIAEVASGEQKPTAYADIEEFKRFRGDHACLWENELRRAFELEVERRNAAQGAPIEASAPLAAEHAPARSTRDVRELAVRALARVVEVFVDASLNAVTFSLRR